MKGLLSLSKEDQLLVFEQIRSATGMSVAVIEKDWWVTQTLRIIFAMDVAKSLVFKGGTSLSKAWGLIERFSEDIDLALDRTFLGFDSEMTQSQVRKLREKSFSYISESFFPQLTSEFTKNGLKGVTLRLGEIKDHDQDPLMIEIYYPSIVKPDQYVQPRVLVEIGSRSLREPFTLRSICSIIGEHSKGKPFADEPIEIPTVNPERTFLEKVFLLHEEFQKPVEKIRVVRLSRHLYDLEKIMDTPYGKVVMEDKQLYHTIVEHRKTITRIRGIDYDNHSPDKIDFLPPKELMNDWKKDYETMQESMIYGKSLQFEKLIERMEELKNRFRKIV